VTDLPPGDGPAIVVAVGNGGVIGRLGALPWHATEDLSHFRELTMGHHVVMGATTWESIGRPLPGRHIVVVSRRLLDLPKGVVLAGSPDAGLDLALEVDATPVVAGGTTIYEALLPRVIRIHRTDVDVDVPDADAHFPALDPAGWREVDTRVGTDPRLTFRTLDRVG